MEIIPFIFFLIFIVISIFTFLMGFIFGKKTGVVVGVISPFLIYFLYSFYFVAYYYAQYAVVVLLITLNFNTFIGYFAGKYFEMNKKLSDFSNLDDDADENDSDLYLKNLKDVKQELEEKVLARTNDLAKEIENRKLLEEKFRTIAELSTDLSYSVFASPDSQVTFDWIGENFKLKTGFTISDFKNNDWRSFIHPDDFDEIEKAKTKLFLGLPAVTELRLKIKDGGYLWVRNFSRSISVSENNHIKIIGACVDITYYKELESKILTSDSKYHRLFNNNFQPIFIFDKDSLEIIEVNLAAVQKYGYSKAELLKMNILHLFDEKTKSELLENFLAGIESLKTNTYKHRLKNGSAIDVKILLDLIELEDKNVYLLMPVDISDNVKLEHENLLLANSLRSIKESVSITDAEDILIYVNDTFCKTYGYAKEELIGKNIEIIRPESSAFNSTSEILTATKNEGFRGELLNRKKDGTYFPVFLTTATVKNESGNPIAFIGVANDISEIKRYQDDLKKYNSELKKLNLKLNNSEKELKDLNVSKDKFFSIIAHDLKNPFAALIGLSEQLYSDIDTFTEDEIKLYATSIYEASQGLYALLENLLQWSRLQLGRVKIEPAIINLNYITQNVVGILNGNAAAKGINLNVDIEPSLDVLANAESISSVIQNLITNAIKFTNTGGQINISAIVENDIVIVKVSDNGIGMDEAKLNKLFKLEHQESSKGTNDEPGSGLGLLICKELVEKNDGRIFVESKPGEGSTFAFTLPLVKN